MESRVLFGAVVWKELREAGRLLMYIYKVQEYFIAYIA